VLVSKLKGISALVDTGPCPAGAVVFHFKAFGGREELLQTDTVEKKEPTTKNYFMLSH